MISLIVAVSENDIIGKNNQLIWHLPADLRYFKENTIGKPVIMGRKTFESIGRPLPQRQNIVITRNTHYIHFHGEPIILAENLSQAIELAGDAPEIMILGGGSIYEQALPLADKIYLTRVHHIFDGDVFFPKLDIDLWHLNWEEKHEPDEKNWYHYTFQTYMRRPSHCATLAM